MSMQLNIEETLRDAKELLNIARSRTGPGSGHDLGKNAIALPAICALLASERSAIFNCNRMPQLTSNPGLGIMMSQRKLLRMCHV